MKRRFLALFILLLPLLMFSVVWRVNTIQAYVQNQPFSKQQTIPYQLKLEDRVLCQRIIEYELWRYRFEGSQEPMHEFEVVMPEYRLKEKVDKYLQQSVLLEQINQPIKPEDLQLEMEWIAKHPEHFQALKEIWEALGNNASLIAECYVRPILVEKKLRAVYEEIEKQQVTDFETWSIAQRAFNELSTVSKYEYNLPKIEPTQSALLINNGGFETGSFSPWITTSGGGSGPFVLRLSSVARSGQHYASLGGDDRLSNQNIRQFFDIPSSTTIVNASFYLNITSNEILSQQLDTIEAVVVEPSGNILRSLEKRSNISKATIGDYTLFGPYDLSSFKGRRIGIAFLVNTDSSVDTNFRIDDVIVSTAALPDFTIAISPSSQTLPAGSIGNYNLFVTTSGNFSSPIRFSFQDLPSGATIPTFAGTSPIPFQVVTSPSTPTGTYTFTIVGSADGLIRTARAVLVVTTPIDFSLSISPSTQTVQAGMAANYNLAVTGNFSGTISASLSNLPPETVAPPFSGASQLPFQLVTSPNTPPGAYSFTVTGTNSGITRTATATLVVTAPGPSISNATFDGKALTITGTRFGASPRILINMNDRSSRLKTRSDTNLVLKGKINKLGIVSGVNSVQVIDSQGRASNLFTFRN